MDTKNAFITDFTGKTGTIKTGSHSPARRRIPLGEVFKNQFGYVWQGKFNVVGDWYCYIVWRCDGEPLEFTEPKDAKAKTKPKGKGKGKGPSQSLGIKRRK